MGGTSIVSNYLFTYKYILYPVQYSDVILSYKCVSFQPAWATCGVATLLAQPCWVDPRPIRLGQKYHQLGTLSGPEFNCFQNHLMQFPMVAVYVDEI